MRRVDVVVDLQFGSTAKGKLCQSLATWNRYDFSTRVQSVQAGHTVYYEGKAYKMRTIPCAWVDPNCWLVLGPGCFIDKDLLMSEIRMLLEAGVDVRQRLVLDYRAYYLAPEDVIREKGERLEQKIGSTAEGAGSSLIRKMRRDPERSLTQVKHDNWAQQMGLSVMDTIAFTETGSLLLEGCQGTLLGMHTSPYYPYVTTRECSASAILGEAGISPFDVRHIWGVLRTFPIRVGGNSGQTGGEELSWEEVAEFCGDRSLVPERTTVTNRQRRIFTLSLGDLEHSLMINRPTYLALTFLDYVNAEDRGKVSWDELSEKSREWVARLEASLQRSMSLISTGADPKAWVRR